MRIERQHRGVPLWVIRNTLTKLNVKSLLGEEALHEALKPVYRGQTASLQEGNTRF